ncbi:MAG: glycosyltransferase family 39 protein, partial [Candidatus Nitrosotenuis sp.]
MDKKQGIFSSYFLDIVDKKLDFFARNAFVSLLILGLIGLALRLYFVKPDIPLILDSLGYFLYANDVAVQGFSPLIYFDIGWPFFLSIFFVIFRFDDLISYMTLQRLVSVSISVLTIIPVYLLGRRFFDKPYALMAAAFFVFEPHIIQNSLTGLSEPFFIFIGTFGLFLFLSPNQKVVYASFGIVALFTIIRSQGIILLPIISILFFLRYKEDIKKVRRYLIALSIFALIVLPISIARDQLTGNDNLFRYISGPVSSLVAADDSNLGTKLIVGTEFLVKQIGKSMIPYFIFFIPFGIFLIFYKRDYHDWVLILTLFISLLVTIQIFSVAPDLRYIFWLFPLFSIISVLTIRYVGERIENHNLFLVLVIIGVIVLSWYFLYINDVDEDYEKEVLEFAKYVDENVQVTNHFLPESGYVSVIDMLKMSHYPFLSNTLPQESPKIILIQSDSLEDYLIKGRKEGLTHLIIDSNDNRAQFLTDVFINEKNYPYLEKIFDSLDHRYKKYHVKVFKIDYQKF